MSGFKRITSQVELDAKRKEILKKYASKLTKHQKSMLEDGYLRPPAVLAYNPRRQVLRWDIWWVGPNGGLVAPEPGDLHFLSDDPEDEKGEAH